VDHHPRVLRDPYAGNVRRDVRHSPNDPEEPTQSNDEEGFIGKTRWFKYRERRKPGPSTTPILYKCPAHHTRLTNSVEEHMTCRIGDHPVDAPLLKWDLMLTAVDDMYQVTVRYCDFFDDVTRLLGVPPESVFDEPALEREEYVRTVSSPLNGTWVRLFIRVKPHGDDGPNTNDTELECLACEILPLNDSRKELSILLRNEEMEPPLDVLSYESAPPPPGPRCMAE
jgi:hypothetical protein